MTPARGPLAAAPAPSATGRPINISYRNFLQRWRRCPAVSSETHTAANGLELSDESGTPEAERSRGAGRAARAAKTVLHTAPPTPRHTQTHTALTGQCAGANARTTSGGSEAHASGRRGHYPLGREDVSSVPAGQRPLPPASPGRAETPDRTNEQTREGAGHRAIRVGKKDGRRAGGQENVPGARRGRCGGGRTSVPARRGGGCHRPHPGNRPYHSLFTQGPERPPPPGARARQGGGGVGWATGTKGECVRSQRGPVGLPRRFPPDAASLVAPLYSSSRHWLYTHLTDDLHREFLAQSPRGNKETEKEHISYEKHRTARGTRVEHCHFRTHLLTMTWDSVCHKHL